MPDYEGSYEAETKDSLVVVDAPPDACTSICRCTATLVEGTSMVVAAEQAAVVSLTK